MTVRTATRLSSIEKIDIALDQPDALAIVLDRERTGNIRTVTGE
jgi:hypothetical protein